MGVTFFEHTNTTNSFLLIKMQKKIYSVYSIIIIIKQKAKHMIKNKLIPTKSKDKEI